MRLGKFVAGRIHQIRSGKSYLADHPSWDNTGANTSCPLCSEALQTFEHAILSCPSSAHQRSRLLQGVSDLAPEAPIWSDQQLLIALAEFIRTTATGFPLGGRCLAPPSAPVPRTPSSKLLPYPPLALKTNLAVFAFLNFSHGCPATLIGRVGGIGYVCFLCCLLV